MISKAKEDDMIQQKFMELKKMYLEKDELNMHWEDLSYVDKEAFAKVLADVMIQHLCTTLDEHMYSRICWKEMSNMVGKKLVLMITEMWL